MLGNIYAENFADVLQPRACTAVKLNAVFGDGILERVPFLAEIAQKEPHQLSSAP